MASKHSKQTPLVSMTSKQSKQPLPVSIAQNVRAAVLEKLGDYLKIIDGLGPIGGLDHGPNEYLQTNSIPDRAALLAGTIVALDQFFDQTG